jgi:hypothetical protein
MLNCSGGLPGYAKAKQRIKSTGRRRSLAPAWTNAIEQMAARQELERNHRVGFVCATHERRNPLDKHQCPPLSAATNAQQTCSQNVFSKCTTAVLEATAAAKLV